MYVEFYFDQMFRLFLIGSLCIVSCLANPTCRVIDSNYKIEKNFLLSNINIEINNNNETNKIWLTFNTTCNKSNNYCKECFDQHIKSFPSKKRVSIFQSNPMSVPCWKCNGLLTFNSPPLLKPLCNNITIVIDKVRIYLDNIKHYLYKAKVYLYKAKVYLLSFVQQMV